MKVRKICRDHSTQHWQTSGYLSDDIPVTAPMVNNDVSGSMKLAAVLL